MINRADEHNTLGYRVVEIWPDHLNDGLRDLAKLTANWQSVVEGALVSPVEQADRRKGQEQLF